MTIAGKMRKVTSHDPADGEVLNGVFPLRPSLVPFEDLQQARMLRKAYNRLVDKHMTLTDYIGEKIKQGTALPYPGFANDIAGWLIEKEMLQGTIFELDMQIQQLCCVVASKEQAQFMTGQKYHRSKFITRTEQEHETISRHLKHDLRT